jgi:hypothetical protein
MAYFIFLKSLTRLEVFRKNPHIKIHPKSHCTNFQNLSIFKDYDLGINRHPGKANVVADALSRKKCCNTTFFVMLQPEL